MFTLYGGNTSTPTPHTYVGLGLANYVELLSHFVLIPPDWFSNLYHNNGLSNAIIPMVKPLPTHYWLSETSLGAQHGVPISGHLANKLDQPNTLMCASWAYEIQLLRNRVYFIWQLSFNERNNIFKYGLHCT